MVVFFDSGVGGLPYFAHFHTRNPAVSAFYLADRAYFPYGPRENDEICRLAERVFRKISEKGSESGEKTVAVVACNTASVASLAYLREKFPKIVFVGTVPALKPAILQSNTGIVGVLGTHLTVNAPYLDALAAQTGKKCSLVKVAARELVEFVENRALTATRAEKIAAIAPGLAQFRAAHADGIVLGCTHFLHLLAEFRSCAAPDMRVYDSVDGVTRRVEFLVKSQGGGSEVPPAFSSSTLYLTGDEAIEQRYHDYAARFGLSAALWEEA